MRRTALGVALAAAVCGNASAMNFDLEGDWKLSWVTTLYAGATWRAQGPDQAMIRALAVPPDEPALYVATNTTLRRLTPKGQATDMPLTMGSGATLPQIMALMSVGGRLAAATDRGVFQRTDSTWELISAGPSAS